MENESEGEIQKIRSNLERQTKRIREMGDDWSSDEQEGKKSSLERKKKRVIQTDRKEYRIRQGLGEIDRKIDGEKEKR